MTAFALPVRDVQSRQLVTVPVTASVTQISRVLEQHSISAVVVVDAQQAIVGMVSMTDLLRGGALRQERPLQAPTARADERRTAKDFMTTPLIAVDDDAPVRAAAQLMVDHRIHRVFVRRGGVIDGIVTTRDVARAVVSHHIETPLEAFMSDEIASVALGDSIDLALERLREKDVRGLVVLDGTFPVGVFAQTEALRARALPREFLSAPVEQVMSYETICLDVSTPIYRAAGHLLALNVRRILAVTHRRLVGVLTGWDVARVATLEPPA